MYNRLSLGTEGGLLTLAPPGSPPGTMTLTDMQNRTWHLLREDGPDTGYPAPTTGDFAIYVVTRDLNIAIAQYISDTGLAPSLSDRMDTFPVYAGLDYPVPPGCISITRVEYNPAGGFTYVLDGLGMEEFDSVTGRILPPVVGQPRSYREPFAGTIRLQPQPGQGQATAGPATGILTIGGTPQTGQQVTATLTFGSIKITTSPYTVGAADTIDTIATALAAAINASAAVVGGQAFLNPCTVDGAVITITSMLWPGNNVTIYGTMTGSNGAGVTPASPVNLVADGDTMTFYYSTLGTVLSKPGDTPGLPPQFHMAPVYRVLMDYWRGKQDLAMAKEYERMYQADVARGKSFVFDSDRSTQPTIAGDDIDCCWPGVAG